MPHKNTLHTPDNNKNKSFYSKSNFAFGRLNNTPRRSTEISGIGNEYYNENNNASEKHRPVTQTIMSQSPSSGLLRLYGKTPNGSSMVSRRSVSVKIKSSDGINIKELNVPIFSPSKEPASSSNFTPILFTPEVSKQLSFDDDDDDTSENNSSFNEHTMTKKISLNPKMERCSGTRTPSQKQVTGASAKDYLSQKISKYDLKQLDKIRPKWFEYFKANTNTSYEWLHAIAFSLYPKKQGTPQTKENLAIGTKESNSEMIIWETVAKEFAKTNKITLDVKFHLFDDTQIIDKIDYSIEIYHLNKIIELNFEFESFNPKCILGKQADIKNIIAIVQGEMKKLDLEETTKPSPAKKSRTSYI